MGFHILKGNFGSVKLDGLNFACIGLWPGLVHEGHGKISSYIDERADSDQFDALSKVLAGKAGGGPFEVYASMADEFQEPRWAKITFQTKDLNSRIKVGDVAEGTLSQ